ncbi:MAG: prepilin-type N-terminal cleavage/methylation domain-containing protein [Ruminococcus sp.]|jgi:prepilin-type N-terminal cleavage/methylation domain-containing protein|nr:prepilin-type N-terminal cleavage/methylation domain-containing protein [Ruminococcus sp.]
MKNKLKGFTLIEMVVVIAILAILAVIIIPSLTTYVYEARVSKANANAKEIYNIALNFMTKVQTGGHTIEADEEIETEDVESSALQLSDKIYSGEIGNKTDSMPSIAEIGDISQEEFSAAIAYYGGVSSDTTRGWYKVSFYTNGTPAEAWWSTSDTDKVVGSWPNQRDTEINRRGQTILEVQ